MDKTRALLGVCSNGSKLRRLTDLQYANSAQSCIHFSIACIYRSRNGLTLELKCQQPERTEGGKICSFLTDGMAERPNGAISSHICDMLSRQALRLLAAEGTAAVAARKVYQPEPSLHGQGRSTGAQDGLLSPLWR